MKKRPDSFQKLSESVYSVHDPVVWISKSEVEFLQEVANDFPSWAREELVDGKRFQLELGEGCLGGR